MNQTPQLCLGTVQFGLPYGVTNHSGQVPEDEVRRIFQFAASSGIRLTLRRLTVRLRRSWVDAGQLTYRDGWLVSCPQEHHGGTGKTV